MIYIENNEKHREGNPIILYFTKEEEEEIYRYWEKKDGDLELIILNAIRNSKVM